MLIEAYLGSLTRSSSSKPSPDTNAFFTQDLPFAKVHELAWFLRWAMSRVIRINEVTGDEVHGLIEWGVYEEWRGQERGQSLIVGGNLVLC